MNSFWRSLTNPSYLLEIASGGRFEVYYLAAALAIILLAVALKLIFRFRGRSKAYQQFDYYLLWGLFVEGLLGLFVWFSRDQGLPIFGTRLASYLWIISLLAYAGFLFYYYKKKLVNEVLRHHERKRKEKYLK